MDSTDRVAQAYTHCHARLWRSLVAFCGDPNLASDAESEAFTQAIARGDAINDVEKWVWKSSFNIARGLLKDRLPLGEVPDQAVGLPFSAMEFIAELGALSEQQRACIVLTHVGLLGPTEVADALGTTPGTVSVQLNRAHEALRLSHSARNNRGRS